MVRATVHVAGPPSISDGQSCARCGYPILRSLRSPAGLLSPFVEGTQVGVIEHQPGGRYTYQAGPVTRDARVGDDGLARWAHRTFGEVVEEPCS
jgi:hypothetical protein